VLRVELAEKWQELATKKEELAKISPLFQLDHRSQSTMRPWLAFTHALLYGCKVGIAKIVKTRSC
jgi:hypothetical protein